MQMFIKPMTFILLTCLFFSTAAMNAHSVDYTEGETLVLRTNLHPDMAKRHLYTLNYQLPGLMPMCAEVTVVKKNKKALIFTWNDLEYTMLYEKHSKRAGISFEQALDKYFGDSCDKDAVEKMSKKDQEGIRTGRPLVGMTRKGILYAMGQPPAHANPDPKAASFLYWRNRFVTTAVDFDANDKVSGIR